LSKIHHAAFDRDLITIDQDYRLRVNPTFETDSDLLQRTIREQAGEPISIPDRGVNPEYLREHNERLEWLAD
jgi:putative restriction endonuclease